MLVKYVQFWLAQHSPECVQHSLGCVRHSHGCVQHAQASVSSTRAGVLDTVDSVLGTVQGVSDTHPPPAVEGSARQSTDVSAAESNAGQVRAIPGPGAGGVTFRMAARPQPTPAVRRPAPP